jgi:D-alanyl-D-alanine carboxypeptidase
MKDPTKMLWGCNAKRKRMIASITKCMTCLICIDLIEEIECDPSDTYIQVNSRAAGIKGTTAKLRKSDIISVQDLLYGLMLPSGNNAAYSLAENFGEYLKERNMS